MPNAPANSEHFHRYVERMLIGILILNLLVTALTFVVTPRSWLFRRFRAWRE